MDIALIAFLGTVMVGPAAFYFLSVVYYKHTRQLRFPSSVKGAIGDTLMLPLFNARAAYEIAATTLVLSSGTLWLALIVTLAVSIAYVCYRKFIVPKLYHQAKENWINTGENFFNALGWYHFGYFVLQTFVIISSFSLFPFDVWLWLGFIGYVATAVVGHYQLKRKKSRVS